MWVKSHQKKKELTIEETANEKADFLATESRHLVGQDLLKTETKQAYKGSLATLKIHSTIINKDLNKMIHRDLYKKSMIEYLVEKYKWNNEVLKDID